MMAIQNIILFSILLSSWYITNAIKFSTTEVSNFRYTKAEGWKQRYADSIQSGYSETAGPQGPAVDATLNFTNVGLGMPFLASDGKGRLYIAVTGQTFQEGTGDGQISAIDMKTKSILWSNKTNLFALSSPVLVDKSVLVLAYSQAPYIAYILSFHQDTGVLQWQYTDNAVCTTMALV